MDKFLINQFTNGYWEPVTDKEFIHQATDSVANKYLLSGKYSLKDIKSNQQFIDILEILLPKEFKNLIKDFHLIDYDLANTSYDHLLEEMQHNINQIFRMLQAISALSKSYENINTIEVANCIRHLSVGLLAEREKYIYYRDQRNKKSL